MPEKIGKYRILERIGRGGMGTVLKAHDPVLDRVVALKVISSDVEVTDELRARFFREAQACARLSHPNIITVYDLADVDGHLFIVMEFLEGEELKQVIAQRRHLLLEDKLLIMEQVCDGLHYAHQHGIVHRDVKPSNIFVLRNGHVKILDFGIARIASAEAGLTLTGLIMGTPRYMAPEQARGHSDHRSDVFSVGTVFYELLAYRPAFAGADPMEILEQLRSHDPPSLVDIDPSMPPVLDALIARALRKDPTERFPELGQMRRELETLRRRMGEDADRLRDGLRTRLRQVRELEARAEEMGGAFEDDTIPVVEGAAGLAPLQMIERQVARRAERVQGLLARAAALEAAAGRGLELLASGDHQAAVEALESVVQELPRHSGAVEGLQRARQRLDEERRRRELTAQLLAQAQSSYEHGGFAASVDALRQLAESIPSAAMAPEVEALRRAAETALAAQEAAALRREALRRERERAERVQARVAQARRVGEQLGAAQDAATAWAAAERKSADAAAAFADEAYPRAVEHLEAALDLYRQAEVETREVSRRRARDKASAARAAVVEARRAAAASGADTQSGDAWTVAADKEARAGAAFEREEFGLALVLCSEAGRDYERAAEAVRQELLRRQRAEADQARARAAQVRGAVRDVDGATHAPALWSAAEGKHAEGETALGAGSLSVAVQSFAEAFELYRRAETESRAAWQAREEQDAMREREQVARARASAEESGAAASPGAWTRAASAEAQGVEALSRGDHASARAHFVEAQRAYEQALRDAREERSRREREGAERARRDVEHARARAVSSAAARYAAGSWSAAESQRAHAGTALAAAGFTAAHERFTEAQALYGRAESEARAAAAAEARGAAPVAPERPALEAPVGPVDDITLLTGRTDDGTRMITPADVARPGRNPAHPDEGRAERRRPWQRRRVAVAGALGVVVIIGAALLFAGKGRQPGEDPGVRARATVSALGREVAVAREAAATAQAERRAPDAFRSGVESERRGEAALGASQLPAATASYQEALERFRAATKDAEAVAGRENKDASERFTEAERRMRESGDVRLRAEAARARRDVALKLGADILAKDAFDGGSAKLGEGDTLARAQNWAAAGQAYSAATNQYGEAERRAKEIGDVRAQAETTKGRREQALKAGAEALAKEAFDAAVSRHTEADRLARGASVTAAIPAYKDAASWYVEAERRAAAAGGLKAQAEAARDRMQGEKRRARGEGPEFAQALVHERQGTEAYQRLAFAGAVEQFARAADLFAKASAPAPSLDPRDEIRAVLNTYVRAFETKDGKLLQTVRPGLKPEDLRRYNNIWDMVASFRIVLKVQQIDVRGDTAEVKGRREDVLIMKDGRREAGGSERAFTFTLRRGRTGWTIDAVN